jgi:hypothetical protein
MQGIRQLGVDAGSPAYRDVTLFWSEIDHEVQVRSKGSSQAIGNLKLVVLNRLQSNMAGAR